MEIKNQQEYLHTNKIIENSSAETLKNAKKTHRRSYQKNYQKAYKKQFSRKEILLTKDELAVLEKAAKNHDMKMRPFLKACVFAYLEKTFVAVDDEQLHEVLVAISRVSNNVNQIAHHLNKGATLDHKKVLVHLFKQLDELEKSVTKSLTCPPTLEELFREAATKDPKAIDRLEKLIVNFRENQKR